MLELEKRNFFIHVIKHKIMGYLNVVLILKKMCKVIVFHLSKEVISTCKGNNNKQVITTL